MAKNYLNITDESLKNAIKDSIITSIFQMFKIESCEENKGIEQILKVFVEDNKDLVDQIVDELMANRRQLFRGTRVPSALEANFEKLEFLRNKLLELIDVDLVISYKLIKNRVKLTYNGNLKLINDCIAEEVFKEIKELVKQAFDEQGDQTELQALHRYLIDLEEKNEHENESANSSEKKRKMRIKILIR